MPKVVGVRFHGVGKAYDFEATGFDVQRGDAVIVETVQGMELGFVANTVREMSEAQSDRALKPILRIATEADLTRYESNLVLEKEAYIRCREEIEKHGLDMHLVSCEYTFDLKKIVFYFTSEGRVDFRELVKSLAAIFHLRIELRQIGVRDEARMTGGLAICGRPYCCASFLNDFVPVSVKMAKVQSMSMNPAKLSGSCGRLMCCLKYEHAAYEEAQKRLPKVKSIIQTPDGEGKVVSVNVLKEEVAVVLEAGDGNDIRLYKAKDLGIPDRVGCCCKASQQEVLSSDDVPTDVEKEQHTAEDFPSLAKAFTAQRSEWQDMQALNKAAQFDDQSESLTESEETAQTELADAPKEAAHQPRNQRRSRQKRHSSPDAEAVKAPAQSGDKRRSKGHDHNRQKNRQVRGGFRQSSPKQTDK